MAEPQQVSEPPPSSILLGPNTAAVRAVGTTQLASRPRGRAKSPAGASLLHGQQPGDGQQPSGDQQQCRATSSSDPHTSEEGGGSERAAEGEAFAARLHKHYEELRQQHEEQQRSAAPAIIAANQAKLREMVDKMRADLNSRSSHGPPLPRTATATASRSGGPGVSGTRSGAGGPGGTSDGEADSGEDEDEPSGDEDDESESDSSYGGTKGSRRPRKKARGLREDNKRRGRPEGGRDEQQQQQQQAAAQPRGQDQGGERVLPIGGNAGVSTRDVKAGRYKTHVLPATERLPQYCSWEFLLRNELARDEGRRMYYVDETGETVPASDDEDDKHFLPWDSSEGPGHDYALTHTLQEEGSGLRVISVLAEHLSVKEERLLNHIKTLQPVARRKDDEIWSEDYRKQAGVLEAAFCRRCGIYNCRQHSGGHIKPGVRPPPLPAAAAGDPPCSAGCWRAVGGRGGTGQGRMGAAEAVGAVGAAAGAAAGGSGAAAAAAGGSEGVGAAPAGGASGSGGKRHDAAAEVEVAAAEAGAAAGQGSEAAAAAATAGERQGPAAAEGGGAEAAAAVSKAGPVAASGKEVTWTPYDLGLLEQAVKILGWDPCQVVLALDPETFTCSEVKRQLDAMRRAEEGEEEAGAQEEDAAGRLGGKRGARRRKKMTDRQSKAARKAVVTRRFQNSEQYGWPAYTPCDCVGPCRAGECSCIDSANFCEKFCGCSGCADAKCRFEGCKCTTRCRTTRCSCLLANRECDPDRCKGCAPTCDGTAALGIECCNMNLRLRRRKHVVMSLSTTHGWGAFMAEDVAKGEFIGEYVGDLLSQEEADRRGRVYDKIDNSYLFNVNQQWVIDARRRGNKLRFANHSTRPNCSARVMQVDGDHRVAIFAAEDIKKGEELFYNYRYDLDNAPDWALTN